MEMKFKNKTIKLDKKKLLFYLSWFEKKDLKSINEQEILDLIDKYNLKDEVFLKAMCEDKKE